MKESESYKIFPKKSKNFHASSFTIVDKVYQMYIY